LFNVNSTVRQGGKADRLLFEENLTIRGMLKKGTAQIGQFWVSLLGCKSLWYDKMGLASGQVLSSGWRLNRLSERIPRSLLRG
jgi:hypothetical protein